jgi:hypothetical protein
MTMKGAALFLNRQLVAGIAAITAGAAAPPVTASAAPHAATMLLCTNLASRASWRISIDFEADTVDSNPARITDATISWHDRTDGGNYTLNRTSGDLTVVLTSSTGGYFLHDHCAMGPLKPRP